MLVPAAFNLPFTISPLWWRNAVFLHLYFPSNSLHWAELCLIALICCILRHEELIHGDSYSFSCLFLMPWGSAGTRVPRLPQLTHHGQQLFIHQVHSSCSAHFTKLRQVGKCGGWSQKLWFELALAAAHTGPLELTIHVWKGNYGRSLTRQPWVLCINARIFSLVWFVFILKGKWEA